MTMLKRKTKDILLGKLGEPFTLCEISKTRDLTTIELLRLFEMQRGTPAESMDYIKVFEFLEESFNVNFMRQTINKMYRNGDEVVGFEIGLFFKRSSHSMVFTYGRYDQAFFRYKALSYAELVSKSRNIVKTLQRGGRLFSFAIGETFEKFSLRIPPFSSASELVFKLAVSQGV